MMIIFTIYKNHDLTDLKNDSKKCSALINASVELDKSINSEGGILTGKKTQISMQEMSTHFTKLYNKYMKDVKMINIVEANKSLVSKSRSKKEITESVMDSAEDSGDEDNSDIIDESNEE